MKSKIVLIGICSLIMAEAVACDRNDTADTDSLGETMANVVVMETTAENIADGKETDLDESDGTVADYALNADKASNSDAVETTEDEILIEIVTTKNTRQTIESDGPDSAKFNGTSLNIEEETFAENDAAADIPNKDNAAEESSSATDNSAAVQSKNGYNDEARIGLNSTWKYADYSAIHTGAATMYLAKSNRRNKIIGINAGHGTSGGTNVKTWCHPDKTAKVTGGTTSAGAAQAVAVSTGMSFSDGTKESTITLKEAQMLKSVLLERGYDVLMIRDSEDVQLDNVARTVICNNSADCHIAIHWDGDGLDYDKGCFYMSVPDGIKYLDNVAATWKSSEALGNSLIAGLEGRGCKIFGDGTMDMDLTQTSYSTVPSIDIELGNQSSDHSDATLQALAIGIADGVESFFG